MQYRKLGFFLYFELHRRKLIILIIEYFSDIIHRFTYCFRKSIRLCSFNKPRSERINLLCLGAQ